MRSIAGVLAVTFAAAAAAQSKPVADPAAVASQVIEETNAFRHSEGLEAVHAEASLARAAQEFARFMARSGKYGHEADGREPTDRAQAAGYRYCVVLENIAYHYDSRGFDTRRLAHAAVEGWKNSPPHRRNMLNDAITQTGVGVARAVNGYYYEVQMFGLPRSASVKFEVRNDSGRTVGYRVGDAPYTVPPRAWRTHETCTREALRFEAQSFTPRAGDRYRVPPEGDVRVERRGASE